MNIILYEGEPFFPSADDRCRHIRKVLKKGPGETFAAGIENGPEGTATIIRSDADGIAFSFEPERAVRPLFPVTLIVGFPRPIQLKRLLRDAASLGARGIILCGTELGEKSYLASSLSDVASARESLVEGCVQAGGTAVPELAIYRSAGETLAALETKAYAMQGTKILLDVEPPDAPSLFRFALPQVSPDRQLLLAIGSERGWTAHERELFREAGFATASLGSRILRTETAATAALAISLARAGFMEGRR